APEDGRTPPPSLRHYSTGYFTIDPLARRCWKPGNKSGTGQLFHSGLRKPLKCPKSRRSRNLTQRAQAIPRNPEFEPSSFRVFLTRISRIVTNREAQKLNLLPSEPLRNFAFYAFKQRSSRHHLRRGLLLHFRKEGL